MKGLNLSCVFKNFLWVCIVLVFTIPGMAFGIHLDLGSASGTRGSNVTISITLNYEGAAPNICATSNDISFDTNVLENPTAAIGPAGSAANKQIISNLVSPGLFRVGVMGLNQNIIQGGILAYVTFRIKESASPGDTTLNNTPSATDPNGNLVTVQGDSGVVHIIFAQKWSGSASISLKFTDIYEDAAGNEKFESENVPRTGILEIYLGEDDLVANEQGCYIYFISEDEQTSFCITQKASISTDYVKITTSDTAYLKGLGTLSTIWNGEKWTGPFFLDLTKATLKKDKLGELVSISVSGKFGGGFDGVAIFSGSLKATLIK
jgi:hypothetical protein